MNNYNSNINKNVDNCLGYLHDLEQDSFYIYMKQNRFTS